MDKLDLEKIQNFSERNDLGNEKTDHGVGENICKSPM